MTNLVGLWVNLARAYEIAILGNFQIQIVFNKEYIQGFSDYENIKSFYNDINFVKNGDLIVELYKPDYTIKTEGYETKTDINKRVEKATKNIKPSDFTESANTLLKTATDRLGFSLENRMKVIEISIVIAQLDGSKIIEPQHIAESIQYSIQYNDEPLCNAENKTINFGKGIEIALYDLDYMDIENAISYLTELKKL